MDKLAMALIEEYGTRNAYELAKKLNITVIGEPLGQIESYYNNVSGQKIIHVNIDLPMWYQEAVVAYQIYHAINNEELNFVIHNRLDFSAESIRFGVHLLIDKEELAKHGFEKIALDRGIEIENIPMVKERIEKIIEGDK